MSTPKITRGIFIVVEGPDGSGKSSQIKTIKDYFEADGEEVVVTRDPGGTDLAEACRDLLLKASHLTKQPDPTTEILLAFASRQHKLQHIIRPAIADGKVVICDRFTHSTLVYQCAARCQDEAFVMMLAEHIHGNFWPDATLIFNASVEDAKARVRSRGLETLDRMESETDDFIDRVHDRYQKWFPRNDAIIRIPPGSLEETTARVLKLCETIKVYTGFEGDQ